MTGANGSFGMNSSRSSRRAGAFSLVELLCVIAIIAILAALMLPALNQSSARVKRIECENNLHQLGIAFQVFAHDHNDQFPMAVPAAEGGAQEFVQNGYATGGEFYFSFRQFQVLSNELSLPVILLCPTDTRFPAANFGALQNSNVSYFIGVKAGFSKPDSILAGDRNLTANSLPNPSILRFETGNRIWWTRELHQFKGNLLFAGGQVGEWNNTALASAAGSQPSGADLFMPTILPAPNATVLTSAGSGSYSGANSGAGTPPPSPATPASPTAHPVNNFPHGQSGTDQKITGPAAQNPPAMAGTRPAGSVLTNSPTGGTVTSEETTDSATTTFDQYVVKYLRRIITSTYLLVLLIFLALLAFKSWQWAQRKKEQRGNGP